MSFAFRHRLGVRITSWTAMVDKLWRKNFKSKSNESASGGAALCTTRRCGLFTANTNVEHVAAGTGFFGSNQHD